MKSPDLNLLVVRKFQGQLWNEWEESIAISLPSPSPSPALFCFKVRCHNIWMIALGSQWNLLSVDAGILQSWSKLNQLVLSYRGKKAFLMQESKFSSPLPTIFNLPENPCSSTILSTYKVIQMPTAEAWV